MAFNVKAYVTRGNEVIELIILVLGAVVTFSLVAIVDVVISHNGRVENVKHK